MPHLLVITLCGLLSSLVLIKRYVVPRLLNLELILLPFLFYKIKARKFYIIEKGTLVNSFGNTLCKLIYYQLGKIKRI